MFEELKLLPCPSCNGDVKFVIPGGLVTASVKCTTCGLSSGEVVCTDCDSPQQEMLFSATELWNALPRVLTWTEEIPKVAGWYWARSTRSITKRVLIEVVEVRMIHMELRVIANESTGLLCLHAFDRWSDMPIPMPKEPTT